MHAFTRGGPPTEGLMKIFRHPDFERLSLVPVPGRRRRKALTAGLAVVPIAFAFSVYAQNKQSNTAIEPTAGEWRTWVISSGKDYRVPPPPAPSDTRAELRNLAELISHNDEQTAAQIAYWDAGAPQYRWIDYISNRLLAGTATTAFPHRVYTYVALAMYDATIATWESKYYYRRSRPSELDRKLPTAVDVPDSPSYPSEHAAAAQAAASVLAYFLPSEAANIQALADQAGWSRVLAGVQFPSDYYAGVDLAQADYFWRNPLAGARTERLTDFPGEEVDAAISPDGKFMAFLSDRAGPFDVWLNQVGTDEFVNVTKGKITLAPAVIRRLGFTGDNTVGFTIDGPAISEILPGYTYLEITGSAPTDVPATPTRSGISIPFSGSFVYCALKSPIHNNSFLSPADQRIAYAQCLSTHDVMVLSKR